MAITLGEIFSIIRQRGKLIRAVRYSSKAERLRIQESVKALGPWFHNYEVSTGVWTNPDGKFPGVDYPAWRWGFVSRVLPKITGKSCLDVGCSSGFFSLKMKDLGAARVLGVDDGEQLNALEQARFAAGELALDVQFQKRSIYQLQDMQEQFDIVLCLGVFYHLRHPLLALENLRSVCRGTLVFQTITTKHGMSEAAELPSHLLQTLDVQSPVLAEPSFPAMKFVEHSLGQDSTCWFIPNPEGVYAMLRASGFHIQEVVFATEYDIFIKCTVD
jgi:tRNA (mo5U34)-methyltransferase